MTKEMKELLQGMSNDQLVNYRCNLASALGLETRKEPAERLLGLLLAVDEEIQRRK